MHNIVAIIQARMSSTRLPGKVLLPLGDKTVLENVVARVQKAEHIGKVIVATTDQPDDNKIVRLCQDKKIAYFRGSMNDVLDRYYQAAKAFGAQDICRVTSDCPLIDPDVIDKVAEKYLTGQYDFVSNSHPVATYPDGFDTWIFSFASLERAWREARLPSDREHVTSYIWNHPEKFKTYNLKNDVDLSKYRLTIDEAKDYELLKNIFAGVADLITPNIIKFLDEHQEVKNINADIARDEGYKKSLANDKLPISVIIRTLNEEVNISDCLKACWENRPAEIIVVDGQSTDKTRELAEQRGAKVIISARGLATQRDVGIKKCSSPFIAIVDADDRLAIDCLATLMREMEEGNYQAIQAQIRDFNKWPGNLGKQEKSGYWQKAMDANLGIVRAHAGKTNMVGRPALYRADALKQIPLDTIFNQASEDSDLSYRFQLKGFKQGIGTGISYRKHLSGLREIVKKGFTSGRGEAAFVYRHPERLFAVIKHELYVYPIERTYAAFLNRSFRYAPFFILTGWCRFVGFCEAMIKLAFIKPGKQVKQSMKVIFIQQRAYEKLGVHQLLGCLKSANIELDLFIKDLETDFYGKIAELKPDFILFSLFIGEESFMLEAFSELKQRLPEVKTIVGGPFVLVFPEIIKNNQIDYIIRGDGENSLVQFFQFYKNNQSLKDVPGISFIEADGSIFANNNVCLTSDLKNLPDPDRDLYYKYEVLRQADTKIFFTSRGCPYNCTYCYNAELKKFYKDSYWRLRDQAAVFREIEYVKNKYGLKWVHFQDGTLNSNIKWLMSFSQEYKRRSLPPFMCNCRAENINDELASLMKQAGCDRITFGIQSGSQTIREEVAKRYTTNKQIEIAIEICHKYGIRVGTDIIFGWPGETIDQAMETIYLCRKVKADTYHSNVLIPYPGLFVTRKAVEQGYLAHEPSLGEISQLDSNKSLIHQPNINYLINMDKLFYYLIKFPRLEKIFKLLLRLPPNRFYKLLKNLHLLNRSFKYEAPGFTTFFKLINQYLKDNI